MKRELNFLKEILIACVQRASKSGEESSSGTKKCANTQNPIKEKVERLFEKLEAEKHVQKMTKGISDFFRELDEQLTSSLSISAPSVQITGTYNK